MGVRDVLDRLRPSGAPGAPSVAGIPADRAVERARELDAVFALLADAQDEAARIRSAAQREAQLRRASADEQAAAITGEAARAARSEREVAAAAVQAAGSVEVDAILAGARTDADRLAERAADRRPALVAAAVARARAELQDPDRGRA